MKVGLYDADFNPIGAGSTVLKLSVKPDADQMKHPVETGATITDFRVIKPVVIELSAVIPFANGNYRNVYNSFFHAFTKGTLLTVLTRAGNYQNMLIGKIPHEENPDHFDAFVLAITLEEALYKTAQYITLPPRKVKRPVDAGTVNTGEKQPTEPTGPQKSLAAKSLDYLSSWFGGN